MKAVYTDPEKAEESFGEGEKLYALQDATITAIFIILTATALGFGPRWVGNLKEEEVQKALRTNLNSVAVVIIGYSDEEPERK